MIQKMIDVRTNHDETQRELAKAIGYHQVQIARYETGENTQPIQYLLNSANITTSAQTIF